MIVNTFNFQWAYKTIKRNIMTVKFEIIFQTTSLKLENYCKKNYQDVIIRNLIPFTVEQLQKLYAMRNYLKKNTTPSDIQDILQYLQKHQWFGDIPLSVQCASIQIHDFDCKYLSTTSSSTPFLVYAGTLTIDLKKIIQYYVQQQYFRVIEKDNKFIKEAITLLLTKPLPKIITQDNLIVMKNVILDIIIDLLSTPSPLSSLISKTLDIKDIHTYKKEVRWENDVTLKILINDYIKLLQLKAKKNIVPLTLAGLYAYHKHKQKKQQQQIITNVYSTILQSIENEMIHEKKTHM